MKMKCFAMVALIGATGCHSEEDRTAPPDASGQGADAGKSAPDASAASGAAAAPTAPVRKFGVEARPFNQGRGTLNVPVVEITGHNAISVKGVASAQMTLVGMADMVPEETQERIRQALMGGGTPASAGAPQATAGASAPGATGSASAAEQCRCEGHYCCCPCCPTARAVVKAAAPARRAERRKVVAGRGGRRAMVREPDDTETFVLATSRWVAYPNYQR